MTQEEQVVFSRAGKRWSDEEKEALKESYPKDPMDEVCAKIPGRSEDAIRIKAGRLNIERIAQDGWCDELDEALKNGFEESQNAKLTPEDRKRLKFRIVTAVNKIAVNRNLHKKKWGAILVRAGKLELSWGPDKDAIENGDSPIESLWDPDILLAFLIEKRKVKDLEKHFGDSIANIEPRLPEKIGKYILVSYRNAAGNRTFYYHETVKSGLVEERIWDKIDVLDEDGLVDDGAVVIKFPREIDWRQIRIYPLASAFYGTKLHDSRRFEAYKRLIARETYHFLIINGSFFPDSLRGKAEDKIEIIMQLENELITHLAPIAHKILWAHQGESEAKLERQLGIDPLAEVCEHLGIPYFRRPVMAEVVWGKAHFSFYCIYGTTSAKKLGTMINALANLLNQFEFIDFLVMSKQKSGMENIISRVVRNRALCRLEFKSQHLVITPGLKKYEGSFEERKGQSLPVGGSFAMICWRDGMTGFSD